MLDFKELSKDGQDLEMLIRELLFRMGMRVYWSGQGADGGKDLICYEEQDSIFLGDTKTWLLQCKHFAHSGKSVGIQDLDDIVDSCNHHGASGYLLVCSTHPSSKVVERLDGITQNPKNNIIATYWDGVKLEQLLLTVKNYSLAQRFFPISGNSMGWQVYATQTPSYWIIHYKGYYFHLANRIGSQNNFHLASIKYIIGEIEKIKLPQYHFIRPRAVFYDDKGACYTWYLDYMCPNKSNPALTVYELQDILGHETALEDGQFYVFDIAIQYFLLSSDHFDIDHNDYYARNIEKFSFGGGRKNIREGSSDFSYKKIDAEFEKHATDKDVFDRLKTALSRIDHINIVRSRNAHLDYLDRFSIRRDWITTGLEEISEGDGIFSAIFLLIALKKEDLFNVVKEFPIWEDVSFVLDRQIFTSNNNYLEDIIYTYKLTISINPTLASNKEMSRLRLNAYFEDLIVKINTYIDESQPKN